MVAAVNIPISDYFSPSLCKRLVVKIGSALLVTPEGTVRRAWVSQVVANLTARRAAGQDIIVVSSGAIALGARRLKLPHGGRASLEDAQAAAAVGQIELASVWAELFSATGLQAAQILLTLDDLENRRRYLNVSATINRLCEAASIPVLNENDSVATSEIRFGDNDRLAARVGQAVQASGVILMSDIDGLFTDNPKKNAHAKLIPIVEKLDAEIDAMAGTTEAQSAANMGSGGMVSKLQAAKIATHGGCHMAIINGTVEHSLERFERENIGTLFLANIEAPAARKRWLAGRLAISGTIKIDAGAKVALLKGSSLLAAGVTHVSGDFMRGDIVDIIEAETIIARGLINYDAQDADKIKGQKSSACAAILGYAPRNAFIHRDDMVIL
jgi:glutamate 5-kinase